MSEDIELKDTVMRWKKIQDCQSKRRRFTVVIPIAALRYLLLPNKLALCPWSDHSVLFDMTRTLDTSATLKCASAVLHEANLLSLLTELLTLHHDAIPLFSGNLL